MVDTAHAGFDLREFAATSLGSKPEDSVALSASDLRILSDKLHVRSDQLKVRLRQILTENYDQFHNIVEDAHVATGGVESLAEGMNKVFDALGEKDENESLGSTGEVSFDTEICRLAITAKQLRKEQEEKREYLAALEFIARVQEGLKSAERAFHQGAFGESGTKLFEIRKQLDLPPEWTADRDDEKVRQMKRDKVKAFNLLEDEWTSCYSKVRNTLL